MTIAVDLGRKATKPTNQPTNIATFSHGPSNFSMQEFLGCTSFGLRHLKRAEKTVNGWYHLLAEEVGCKKHLQVATKQRPVTSQPGKD